VTNPPEFKLSPCPFCGGAPNSGPWADVAEAYPDAMAIECSSDLHDCPINPSACGYTPGQTIAAWNRRASPSPPSEPDGEFRLQRRGLCRCNLEVDSECDACLSWKSALATRPAAPDGEVSEAMVEAGLAAARDASDARLPRYKVVRAIIEAARIAPVALSSEERIALEYAEQRWSGSTKSADHEMATILCALVRRLTTNEPKGNDR
jgi:hypothetical protein